MMIRAWIKAMRPQTLPVSAAGVLAACSYAVADGCFAWPQCILCLLFAMTAQVASNFANEYYDYRDGIDRKGRAGFRRGVSEGDISPRSMLYATYTALALAGIIGLSLLAWGSWWLLAAGCLIAVGAVGYSAGPYPLSRHALGEVAVFIFFGIVPVCLTYYVMAGSVTLSVLLGSAAIGLLAANVLIVNNYRDIDDDRAVDKRTLAVVLGPLAMKLLYKVNCFISAMLLIYSDIAYSGVAVIMFYIGLMMSRVQMRHYKGAQLNATLGYTALLLFATAVGMLVSVCL